MMMRSDPSALSRLGVLRIVHLLGPSPNSAYFRVCSRGNRSLGRRYAEGGKEGQLFVAVGVGWRVVDHEHDAVCSGHRQLLAVEFDLADLWVVKGERRPSSWPDVVAGPHHPKFWAGQGEFPRRVR